ncbi:MAG: V-type ATP synthase subunit D [Kiritimatiellae bacterium]|nr:V-type ATP synthase subunit D [Kiritimatiellia bacterium]
MPKLKYTKTELKAQNDALKRYRRFLPMLQLKKQQLQIEIAAITAHIEEVQVRMAAQRRTIQPWVALFSDESLPDTITVLERVVTDEGNIAGVSIPLYRGIETRRAPLDLYETPAWHDEAQAATEALLALRAEESVLTRQRALVTAELLTTSQRVNLFEKVKIPECRENIRVIRIHLGDEQTAGVARGKIAKRRGAGREAAA